jgi:hypothetical protein
MLRLGQPLLAACAGVIFLSGCGGGADKSIDPAGKVKASEFPAPAGRTLRQMADGVQAGPQVGLATSVLLPGTQRLAFGIIDAKGTFLYAKTAIYIARGLNAPASGPYPAPIDSMRVRPAFVSKTSSLDAASIKAIYAAQIPFPRPGRYALLSVSKTPSGLTGAATTVKVRRSSPIPNVGERPPAIHTDTVASARGNLNAIDTRNPHDDMHKDDFASVIGKRPVALLISTPQLCQSRVCGPVTDIAVALEEKYGSG